MDPTSDTPQPTIWFPPSPLNDGPAAPTLLADAPEATPDAFPLIAAQPPMRKRKLGLVVGLAAILAAVGAGAFVVTQRSGDDDATYSLPAAAEAAAASSTVEYTVSVDVNGKRSADFAVASDTAQQRQRLTMDIASIGVSTSAIVDIANHTGYFDASAFAGMLGAPDDAKWLSFDLDAVSAIDFDKALQEQGGNPLDVAPLFLNAIDTQDLGLEEVNGEQVKHYSVTVDGAAGLANQPKLAEQLEKMGGLPDTVTYEVYVNEANELRRLTFEVAIGGATTTVDIVIASVGQPVDIEIPAEADVWNVTEMFGGIGD